MSNFPNNFDDDTTLPFVNDNITEIGGEAIDALRDAVFAIEQNIGLGAQGTTASISERFGVSFFPNGTLKPSAITSLGLVTLPITEDQIADFAQIPESKLRLDHRTQDLFNYIRDLSGDVNVAIGWISTTGIKLEPHLIGAIYRHSMDQIDVSTVSTDFLSNNLRLLRNNLNSYTLVADINAELLAHQWADGSPFGIIKNITTNNGSVYPDNYAHVASGVFINTTRFNNIPQSADDVQLFAEFIDSASIFLLGTRIQNLYTNGISRVSRSSNLTQDGYGQFIIPNTPAIAYLKNVNNSSSPVDSIDIGDDIIEFNPSLIDETTNNFDAKFALVKPGDIIRINYGTIEVPFLIKEKKYSGTIGSKKYVVRIAGKNQFYSPNAIARIDRPLFNNNKFGELSISPVSVDFLPSTASPSLIINNPRGAQALGLGFNADQLDEKHYLLYIAFYPTGFAQDGYTILPGIDVTGNQGQTPGLYTLESVALATNKALRQAGFNYRLTAFTYQGDFGICLSDSYNNAAFSIVSAALKADGTIDTLATQVNLPNNVVDLVPAVGNIAQDPLGFGPTGSGIASPPFYSTYGSPTASQSPTKLFVPLRRNSYYVNGTEKERLNREVSQALDGYGDGYWVAEVFSQPSASGRQPTIYRVPLDLSTSGLKVGKTIVVQSLGTGNLLDFGRFVIQDVSLGCCSPSNFTDITVYDAVHATGFSPATVLPLGSHVALYFGPDSVSFNAESATDLSTVSPFKRHFEVYVNDNGDTFTHERGRVNISGSTQTVNGVSLYGSPQLNKLDIVKISPKLRGYAFGSVNKITLRMFNYSSTTGIFDGYLSSYDGTFFTHIGPRTTGKQGEITRFYDETNTDYIDIIFDINASVSTFTDQVIDFQLFPTLSLDDEIMLIGTCQVNDTTRIINRVLDARQFGNTSEKDLSSSVFDYMSIPEKHLHSNGVIRGFDIFTIFNGSRSSIDMSGGVALINGKILNINNDTITIPMVREVFSSAFYPVNWALCVNDKGEYDIVPLLDVDVSLGTPSTSSRVFTAADFVSTTTYNLPGVLFADLVNTRTDLTVLHIFSATVTGTPASPIITVTSKDARKFVYKKDWGETPTLVAGTANGDFRSFEALSSWFRFDSTYTNTVNVKGIFTSLPSTLSYSNPGTGALLPVIFTSDGTTAFNPSGTFSATQITFNNISFTYASSLTFTTSTLTGVTLTNAGSGSLTMSSCTANNCTINVNNSGSSIFMTNTTFNNVTFNFNTINGVNFSSCILNNCTLNFNGTSISFNFTGTSVMNKCAVSFNGAMFSANMTNLVFGSTFTWNVPSIPITVSSNFNMVDNQFIALGASLTNSFITITDGSNGVISRNSLFRNSNNNMGSYILAPATYTSGVVSIVDNFFDSTTFNGTDQNLVKNLPLKWVYKNNLNTPFTTNVRRFTGSGTYNIALEDVVVEINLTGTMTINLPSIALSPPGRVITIKDANGNCSDTVKIIIHPFGPTGSPSDAIENLYADYVHISPYGSITLAASIDPNGGASGSGLPPQFMWSVI